MNTGILWWDDATNKPLAKKVQEAAQYYRRKYDRIPDLCLVNPKMLDASIGAESEVDVFGEFKTMVRPWNYVVPDHLWIGVEDQRELTAEKVDSPL